MPIPDIRALKSDARALIRTGSVSPIRMTALLLVISFALELLDSSVSYMIGSSGGFTVLSFSFISILIELVTLVLNAGYTCYSLGILRGERMPYESLFDAFSFAGKVILLSLVQGLFIFLWSLLFFIPGIIAAYRYSFAIMNLCDNPSLGVMEALDLSKRQTNGYKGQLFLLSLSFFGWMLLAGAVVMLVEYLIYGSPAVMLDPAATLMQVLSLTFVEQGLASLAALYLTPYMHLSFCGFYRAVTSPAEPPQPQLPQDGWNGSF